MVFGTGNSVSPHTSGLYNLRGFFIWEVKMIDKEFEIEDLFESCKRCHNPKIVRGDFERDSNDFAHIDYECLNCGHKGKWTYELVPKLIDME